MTIHYAADRTPPGLAGLVAFSERAAIHARTIQAHTRQDGFMKHPPANLAYGRINQGSSPVGGRVKRASAPRPETETRKAVGVLI